MHVGTTPQLQLQNTAMGAAVATAPDEDDVEMSCVAAPVAAPVAASVAAPVAARVAAPVAATLKRGAPAQMQLPHGAGTPFTKRRRCEGASAVTSLAPPASFAAGKAAPTALIDMPHVPFATLQRVAVPPARAWSMGPQ